MRQGQQHRRGRGRNNNNNSNSNSNNSSHSNNNRRGHNPLSRSFESNGPDVKVRGTPAHVAEKYLTLARDAQSSGDPVLAENYLQHAEHYNRIILAYREQQMQHSGEPINGNGPRMRPSGSPDGEGDDVLDEESDDPGQGEQPPMPRFQDQPRAQDQQRSDDGRQQARGHDQSRFRDRQDRHERQHERQTDRQPDTRQARDRAGEPQPPPVEGAGQPRNEQLQRRRERFGPGNEQPDFLRRPVRRPRREGGNGEAEGPAESGHDNDPQDKTTV